MQAGYEQTSRPVDTLTVTNCLLTTLLVGLIAAGMSYVGLAFSRFLMSTPIFEPTGDGGLLNTAGSQYALLTALVAALATVLLFTLIALDFPATPQLFGALLFVGTAAVTVAPLTLDRPDSWKIALALTNLITGIVVSTVLMGVEARYGGESSA
jgi:hypothetical protein